MNGHICHREVSTNRCIACIPLQAAAAYQKAARSEAFKEKRRAWARNWATNNPERTRENQTNWRNTNLEKARELSRTNYRKHADARKRAAKKARQKNAAKIKVYIAEWKRKNPERVKALQKVGASKRRARELAAEGSFTADDVARIFALQKGRCAHCRSKGPLHLDHIKALAREGTNHPRNLQFLCAPCNLSKGAKDAIEWAQEHGQLL